MFNKFRNRLTLVYGTVMAIFLLVLLAVITSGITWLVYAERRDEIRLIAKELGEEHKERLIKYLGQNVPPEIVSQDDTRDISGQMFYYLTDAGGRLIKIDEPNSVLKPFIDDILQTGGWPDSAIRIEHFTLPEGQKATVILAVHYIYDGQKLLGTLLAGKDITAYYQVLNHFLYILLGVSILFLTGAAGLGHLLAGRAMIPIEQAYFRQRQFVADASHELRTPLSVLMTSLEFLQGEEANDLTPLSRQVVHDMQDEVRKTTRIVGDLLTLARADTGNTRCLRENFDLIAVAERVFRGLTPQAAAKDIAITVAGPDSIRMEADQAHLEQLLYILADNAIKYTQPGGTITVSLSVDRSENPSARIIVTDTGIGIPPEYQSLVFERFFRVDKARSREDGGVGLGLAIAESIVHLHGGTIELTSSPDKGSSFTVTLPCGSKV
ncbi:MAG: ATP-binding protein [Negativicutes bacterium]|nr:ATP-binding protein [Negativicutes bacterium]